MTELHWHQLRRQALDGFNGELPNGPTEQAIIDTFELEPRAVQKALADVINDHQAGKIRSGWAIWRKRCEQLQPGERNPSAIIDNRETQIAAAEAWIRNAGIYLQTEHDIIHHLFTQQQMTPDLATLEQIEQQTRQSPGRPIYEPLLRAAIARTREHGPEPIPDTAGPLAQWDTPQLRERMTNLWHQHRPRGIQADQASLEHQQDAAASYWRVRQHVRHTAGQDEAERHAMRIAQEITRARHAHQQPVGDINWDHEEATG